MQYLKTANESGTTDGSVGKHSSSADDDNLIDFTDNSQVTKVPSPSVACSDLGLYYNIKCVWRFFFYVCSVIIYELKLDNAKDLNLRTKFQRREKKYIIDLFQPWKMGVTHSP